MFSKAKSNNKAADAKSQNGLLNEASPLSTAAQPSSGKRSNTQSKAASGMPSLISADVVMNGNINASGEVQFDGSLEGDIKAASLIIGEQASVTGEVVCETVVVRGRVEGAIRAKSVSLSSTAHIQGDILHSSLSVESGAHFEGNCRHSDDPLSESASKDFRRATPTGSPAPRPVAAMNEENDDLSSRRQAANEAPSFLSGSKSPLR